jgi:hypothetical protein
LGNSADAPGKKSNLRTRFRKPRAFGSALQFTVPARRKCTSEVGVEAFGCLLALAVEQVPVPGHM